MNRLLILLALTFTVGANANYSKLKTVDHVDIERYMGKWYEIARFDQKFQKNCTAVTADYSLRKNGTVKVVNKCRLFSPTGKQKKSIGRAWVKDKSTNAKLKVQFFLKWLRLGFLAGNYWIIELDEDYQYAMIGDPSREYLWILSRTAEMDEATYLELVSKAERMEFNVENLLKTVH